MAKVITIANAKGGCGKSTIAMLLAGALDSAGLRAVVVDSDPQGTSSLWGAIVPGAFPVPVVPITAGDVLAHLRQLAQDYAVVLVDCPPNLDAPVFGAALALADLVLIPCAPEPLDQWATAQMLEYCKTNRPGAPARVVANKVPSGTALAREVMRYIESSWPLLRSKLGLRTAYKESAALGTTLDRMKGAGARTARDEVVALALEVLSVLTTAGAQPSAAPEVQPTPGVAPLVAPTAPAAAPVTPEVEPTRTPDSGPVSDEDWLEVSRLEHAASAHLWPENLGRTR